MSRTIKTTVTEKCECLSEIVTLSNGVKACLTCEEVGWWPEVIHLLDHVMLSDGDGDILGKSYFMLACEPMGVDVKVYDPVNRIGFAFTTKLADVTCEECKVNGAELDSERYVQGNKSVVVNLPEGVLEHIDKLRKTGLWGANRDEVIERLVCEGLRGERV